MGRPRATAAASRPRRGNPSTKPKPKPSFLSPLASPAPAPRTRTRTRKRVIRGGSSPASSSPSSSPAGLSLSFLSSPGSPASSPKPKPKPRARAKPAARSPPVASPLAAASPLSTVSPQPAAASAVSSVGELRSAVASQMEGLKRRLDALHSRAHADLDASLSRVSKRVKTQNQACQQLTDEVDKEYKKMSNNIKESSEIIKAKYKQIMAEAQSCTTRVCKVTIPEITKSVEKAIDGLCSRYNISMLA